MDWKFKFGNFISQVTDAIKEIGSENKIVCFMARENSLFGWLAEEEKQQFSVVRSEARLPGFEFLLCQLLALLPYNMVI